MIQLGGITFLLIFTELIELFQISTILKTYSFINVIYIVTLTMKISKNVKTTSVLFYLTLWAYAINALQPLLFAIFNGLMLFHTGMKPAEDPLEEMNSMDDDLASLLTNFPSAMPTPEWYRGGRHLSNGQSSGVESDNVRLDTQQSASPAPVTNTTEPELEWGLSPCYWKNLPGIC